MSSTTANAAAFRKLNLIKWFRFAGHLTEEASRTAQRVTDTISQKGEEIAKSQAYRTISDTARIVRDEIDIRGRVYRPPAELRLRRERDLEADSRIIEINTEATGITVHRDSKFSQSWQDFRDSNPYINKVLEWRAKLDESDNPMVRASLLVKDKVSF